ncbi:MAG TPA: SigE family RNA polymerase sigma factor [Streptosporangiaceae bacterium]|nr:SigE family RNA polymerase sigma factor [Streptosporangiaceae bacterium]
MGDGEGWRGLTYRSWSKINDRAALDAYVRRAMVNTHISWWRRRLDEYPADELPDEVVADHARESDMAEVIRRALDRLPQRMHAAVMLRYFEDMTEPEIAATLGISLGTVKSTVSRAVARLRIDAELAKDSGASSPILANAANRSFAACRNPGPGRPGRCDREGWATAGYLTHGTIRYAGQAPSRRWLGAEHDDGCPADDHIGHAVRNVRIRGPGGRHLDR